MNRESFDYKRIAQGYKDRPFLHGQVIDRFQRDVTDKMFVNGLDVGCGAGLSSRALRRICNHVTGADLSSEMIAVAREACKPEQEYEFIVSKAEELPAPREKYDIVTGAGVIPWVDRDAFLNNLKSVIQEHGYVFLYDFWISDQMKGSGNYSAWWHDAYLKEFPKPFRDESIWTQRDVAPYGFSMLDQVTYELEYEFDRASFIRFMMLQSNVSAKIEGGEKSLEEVQKWFETSLATVFGGERKTLIFTGYSWYMKAESNCEIFKIPYQF